MGLGTFGVLFVGIAGAAYAFEWTASRRPRCKMTEGAFFQDIALVMAVAGLVAALFSRMRWPKVIGYIGAVIGSHAGPGTLALFFMGNEK